MASRDQGGQYRDPVRSAFRTAASLTIEPWNPLAGVLQSGQLTLDKVGCSLKFQSRPMVSKGVFAAVCCAAILAAGSSWADDYRPDEVLTLDLSKAALSPKPLGPPAQFEPMRGEAKTDPQSNAAPVDAGPAPVDAVSKHVNAAPKAAKTRILHARAEQPRAPVRTKLARRHSNPLDAQAFDTRIQVWPCKSGGICNWQR
jgi:hypothetical protein